MDYQTYSNNKKTILDKQKTLAEELRVIANKFFSSEDGKKYANQMLTAVKYFDVLPSQMSDNDLRYLQAQRDFVNIFLTGLVDKKILLTILEDR